MPVASVAQPPVTCTVCGSQTRLQPRRKVPAAVLEVGGWALVHHVPRRCPNKACTSCFQNVWYNYKQIEGKRVWQWPATQRMYYMFLGPRWGVSTEWLRQMSARITYQYSTFSGEARVHCQAARLSGLSALVPSNSEKKLLEAWLKWRVVVRTYEHDMASSRNDLQNLQLQRTVQELFVEMHPWYPQMMLEKRAQQARRGGSTAHLAVIDGHAKWSRSVCGKKYAEVVHSHTLGKFICRHCSETPLQKHSRDSEGNSLLVKHRWCTGHVRDLHCCSQRQCVAARVLAHRRPASLLGESVAEAYKVLAELAPRRRCLQSKTSIETSVATSQAWIPASEVAVETLAQYWSNRGGGGHLTQHSTSSDLTSSSCNTHKETERLRRVTARAGGWLFALTGDGCILHMMEFMGAESLSQRYFFLAELKERFPELVVVVHDDACHLWRYATARSTESTMALSLAFPNMAYITDRLHGQGHTDKWCLENCQPDNDHNKPLVKNVNTSICEQTFSILSRYKHAIRHMAKDTCHLFAEEVVDLRNEDWCVQREQG